jgi:hypothetical protein
MNAAAFNSIFMIARTPGLVAHGLEEQTREKPMRRIDPVKHGYDGPPPRGISDGNPKCQDPNPREKETNDEERKNTDQTSVREKREKHR